MLNLSLICIKTLMIIYIYIQQIKKECSRVLLVLIVIVKC